MGGGDKPLTATRRAWHTHPLFNSVRTRHLMVLDYIKPPGGEVSTSV